MRTLLRVVVALAVVAAVVVVAGGQLVESRVGASVRDAVAARAVSVGDVDTDLEGTPLVYHVAVGRLPRVTTTVEQLEIGAPPVTFRRVTIDLRDVAFALGDALDGPPTELTARAGAFEAAIGEDELRRVVARDRPGFALRLDGGDVVVEGTVAGRPVTLVAEPRVERGDLVLAARRVEAGGLPPQEVARAFDLTVPIAGLPGGVRASGARVDGDALVLTGRLEFARFSL